MQTAFSLRACVAPAPRGEMAENGNTHALPPRTEVDGVAEVLSTHQSHLQCPVEQFARGSPRFCGERVEKRVHWRPKRHSRTMSHFSWRALFLLPSLNREYRPPAAWWNDASATGSTRDQYREWLVLDPRNVISREADCQPRCNDRPLSESKAQGACISPIRTWTCLDNLNAAEAIGPKSQSNLALRHAIRCPVPTELLPCHDSSLRRRKLDQVDRYLGREMRRWHDLHGKGVRRLETKTDPSFAGVQPAAAGEKTARFGKVFHPQGRGGSRPRENARSTCILAAISDCVRRRHRMSSFDIRPDSKPETIRTTDWASQLRLGPREDVMDDGGCADLDAHHLSANDRGSPLRFDRAAPTGVPTIGAEVLNLVRSMLPRVDSAGIRIRVEIDPNSAGLVAGPVGTILYGMLRRAIDSYARVSADGEDSGDAREIALCVRLDGALLRLHVLDGTKHRHVPSADAAIGLSAATAESLGGRLEIGTVPFGPGTLLSATIPAFRLAYNNEDAA